MSPFALGALMLVAALALVAFAVVDDSSTRVPKGRRRAPEAVAPPPAKVTAWDSVVDRMNAATPRDGWSFLTQEQLDAADVKKSPATVMILTGLGGVAALVVASQLLGSLFLGIVLAVLAPVVTKVVLRTMASRRRKAFAGQLDQTLRIIASALRAGQSLPMALASVSLDAQEPMRQELGRVVNETRVGRDLVESLHDTAERMRSEDLHWFAEAVEVQRDTGGNLNDIIDTVAETIRDRAEIREKVNAYASEGKASAVVLMGLPVALGILYSLMNPGYLQPLFSTLIGILLLVLSAVLYVVAFFWMRAIVNIKV